MKRRSVNVTTVSLSVVVAMVVAGIAMHGFSLASFERGWQNVVDRPSQSLAMRFILQPLVSCVLAIRDGVKDARTGNSPYFWTIVANSTRRAARLHEGINAAGKIFLVAILLDVIYQFIELKAFYPGEALVVALVLAFIPYLVVRGPVTRVARRLSHNPTPAQSE